MRSGLYWNYNSLREKCLIFMIYLHLVKETGHYFRSYKKMKLPSHECYMTFCSLAKYNDNPPPIRVYTNCDHINYRTRHLTESREVSKGHLRRVWQVDRGCSLLQTHGPVPFGTANVLLFETIPYRLVIPRPKPALPCVLYCIREGGFGGEENETWALWV